MRALTILVLALLCTACAETQHQKEVDAANAIDEAARDFEAQLPPQDRKKLREQAEQNAQREIEAAALACGTRVQFTDEPRYEDRSVFIVAGATSAQVACVQKQYPFVRSHR